MRAPTLDEALPALLRRSGELVAAARALVRKSEGIRAVARARRGDSERLRQRLAEHRPTPVLDRRATRPHSDVRRQRTRAKSPRILPPHRMATEIWHGMGRGLACDGCDEPVVYGELEAEVQFAEAPTLLFHFECFDTWRG